MKSVKPQNHLTAWLILGGLLAALTACAASETAGVEPRTINLPPEGGQIEARLGDMLELTLEGNPTTGFNWEVEALDEAVLEQEGDPVLEPESDMIGAPSAMTFRFKAVGTGQTTLTMSYCRPWEEGVEPVRTYRVEITVKP